MRTYTLMLDILIASLLLLSVQFSLTDSYIADSYTSRRGVIRNVFISWQTLFFLASFCIFLRYIAGKLR